MANEHLAVVPLDIGAWPRAAERTQRARTKTGREPKEHERLVIGVAGSHLGEGPRHIRRLDLRAVKHRGEALIEVFEFARYCRRQQGLSRRIAF